MQAHFDDIVLLAIHGYLYDSCGISGLPYIVIVYGYGYHTAITLIYFLYLNVLVD